MRRKLDKIMGREREDDAQLVYGGFYNNNTDTTTTISLVDTFYEIGSGMTTGTLYGMTFANARELVCQETGKYFVTWSMSVQTGSANQEVEGAVMVTDVAQANGTAHTNLITANRPLTISGNGVFSLSVNSTVSLALSNHTGANNITMNHASLTAIKLGI